MCVCVRSYASKDQKIRHQLTFYRLVDRKQIRVWGCLRNSAAENQNSQLLRANRAVRLGEISLDRTRPNSPARSNCLLDFLSLLSTLEQSRRLALHAPWESAGNGTSPAGTQPAVLNPDT